MIRNGTEIVFTVNGQTGQWIPRTSGDVRTTAINELTPYFDVADVQVKSKGFLEDPVHYIANWPYTATVRATVKADYADVRDVDSIVAHAFYNAAGELPTVTAAGQEAGQGDPNQTTGFSITTLVLLIALALGAVAVIKVVDVAEAAA